MMDNALEMIKLVPGTLCPVMVTKIPPQILKEIDVWVSESKKFKNSPLAELKANENVGYLCFFINSIFFFATCKDTLNGFIRMFL